MRVRKIHDRIIKLILFISGFYLLFKFIILKSFIPVESEQAFYNSGTKTGIYIIKKANPVFDDKSESDNKLLSIDISALGSSITGIHMDNPITIISSSFPAFSGINPIASGEEEGPVAVKPYDDEEKDIKVKEKSSQSSKAEGKKIATTESGVSIITPKKDNANALKRFDPAKPLVLIVHTHTTECYNPNDKANANFTTNLNLSVASVGENLKKILESSYGIPVIHDTTIHDIPKRAGAYEKSRPTEMYYIKKYPSLKLLIDLHRDGDVKRASVTAVIHNERYARTMFVIGSGYKGYEQNRTAQILNGYFSSLYPGFSRGIDVKKGKYNQDLSRRMVLIEVGSNSNSLDEAMRSASVMARVIKEFVYNSR